MGAGGVCGCEHRDGEHSSGGIPESEPPSDIWVPQYPRPIDIAWHETTNGVTTSDTIRVTSSITATELLRKLAPRLGITPYRAEKLSVLFNGKQLLGWQDLSSCAVVQGSEIEIYGKDALLVSVVGAQAWYDHGLAGGVVIDHQQYTEDDCFKNSLEEDDGHSEGWVKLSHTGGKVGGMMYSKKQCVLQALTANPGHAKAWVKLSNFGGGEVREYFVGKKECLERALNAEPMYARAWVNLGASGGGTVLGEDITRARCYQKALEADPSYSRGWFNLGNTGGGRVNGQFHNKKQCYEKALAADEANPLMWFNLGNAGGGAVWGKDFTAPECYQQSLDADPTSPNAWCNPTAHCCIATITAAINHYCHN